VVLYRTLGQLVFPAFSNLLWRLPRRQKTIYLTFDDGPNLRVTSKVVKILNEYEVPATFFLLGENLNACNNDVSEDMYSGHTIGNHGYDHRVLLPDSQIKIKKEIEATDDVIRDVLAVNAKLFRPPFGIFGPALLRTLRHLDKDLVLWSLMSNDFKWDEEKVFHLLKQELRNGDIIVFHDSAKNGEVVIELLPRFLDFCLEQGYSFSTIPNRNSGV
jgi:peptidoglycan/xylan/chitin deacetylase (PgdA/CDA1 family)